MHWKIIISLFLRLIEVPLLASYCSYCYRCYHPQTKFAKIMFSQVSVCPQGVSTSGPGVSATHPWADTPCSVHAGIRGRYASHWNAFLYLDLDLLNIRHHESVVQKTKWLLFALKMEKNNIEHLHEISSRGVC